MEGKIKKKEKIFPVTAMEAVAVGDGTSKMLPQYLEENFLKSSKIDAQISEISENPVQNKVIAAALKNVSVPVDSELSETSKNPVQNKIITEKLNEVFTSVSNGKELIAGAIAGKGVPTPVDATFRQMADNIDKIEGGGTGKDNGVPIICGVGAGAYTIYSPGVIIVEEEVKG